MIRFCQKCGAEIPEGSPVCRSCFEPVKSEGFLARLMRLVGGGRASSSKTPSMVGTAAKIHTTELDLIRRLTSCLPKCGRSTSKRVRAKVETLQNVAVSVFTF